MLLLLSFYGKCLILCGAQIYIFGTLIFELESLHLDMKEQLNYCNITPFNIKLHANCIEHVRHCELQVKISDTHFSLST